MVELDRIFEVIHIVDHLSQREFWLNFNLTFWIETGVHASPQCGVFSLTVVQSGTLVSGDTVH